jgi:hypothetical protein
VTSSCSYLGTHSSRTSWAISRCALFCVVCPLDMCRVPIAILQFLLLINRPRLRCHCGCSHTAHTVPTGWPRKGPSLRHDETQLAKGGWAGRRGAPMQHAEAFNARTQSCATNKTACGKPWPRTLSGGRSTTAQHHGTQQRPRRTAWPIHWERWGASSSALGASCLTAAPLAPVDRVVAQSKFMQLESELELDRAIIIFTAQSDGPSLCEATAGIASC